MSVTTDFSGQTTEEFWCILRPDGSLVRKSPTWGSAFWKAHPVAGVYGYPTRGTDKESVEHWGLPELTDELIKRGVKPDAAQHKVVRVVVTTGVAIFTEPTEAPNHDRSDRMTYTPSAEEVAAAARAIARVRFDQAELRHVEVIDTDVDRCRDSATVALIAAHTARAEVVGGLPEQIAQAIGEQTYLDSPKLDPAWITGWNAATSNAQYVTRKIARTFTTEESHARD